MYPSHCHSLYILVQCVCVCVCVCVCGARARMRTHAHTGNWNFGWQVSHCNPNDFNRQLTRHGTLTQYNTKTYHQNWKVNTQKLVTALMLLYTTKNNVIYRCSPLKEFQVTQYLTYTISKSKQ